MPGSSRRAGLIAPKRRTLLPYHGAMFSDRQLEVVRFCAIECELQRSGEQSVWWMLGAWEYASARADRAPTEEDVLALAALVEPGKNLRGYRQVGVRVGNDVKGDWRLVPRQVANLVKALGTRNPLSPEEWFREFEDVHPFVDGNGRTGQILFNWLCGTLDSPKWAPDFWGDERRSAGYGA